MTPAREGPDRGAPKAARARRRPVFILTADPRRRQDLLRLVHVHRRSFARWTVVAPADTAAALRASGLAVDELRSETGHPGSVGRPPAPGIGVAAMVARGSVDVVIALVDTAADAQRDRALRDIPAVVRACDVHGVPLATNLATAALVIRFQTQHDEQVEHYEALIARARERAGNCPGPAESFVERSPPVQEGAVVRAISPLSIGRRRNRQQTLRGHGAPAEGDPE